MSAIAVLSEPFQQLIRPERSWWETRRHVRKQDTIARSVPVPGIARAVEVKIVSRQEEWEQAFRLVAHNYQARGYEPYSAKRFRFTPYHVLPKTTTFVAKEGSRVLATLALVQDNNVLGLPIETICPSEINALRHEGCYLAEVTSLADQDLINREFLPVFTTLLRVSCQYAVEEGVDTWVITVNPRHRKFYEEVMGFVPIGASKSYPAVQNHPAEAFAVTVPLLKINSPAMHKKIFGEWLPQWTLTARPMPADLVRYFAADSCQTDGPTVEKILSLVRQGSSPRRW
jgi:hypothetical protein